MRGQNPEIAGEAQIRVMNASMLGRPVATPLRRTERLWATACVPILISFSRRMGSNPTIRLPEGSASGHQYALGRVRRMAESRRFPPFAPPLSHR